MEWLGFNKPVTAPADAATAAGKAKADVAVFGQVNRMELVDDEVHVNIRLTAVGADGAPLVGLDGERLFDRTFTNKPAIAVRRSGPLRLWALAGLAIFALAWPLALVPVMRRVITADSNVANLLAIVLITAVPASVAAVVLLTGGPTTTSIVEVLVLLVLAGLWCAIVMSRVADAERG